MIDVGETQRHRVATQDNLRLAVVAIISVLTATGVGAAAIGLLYATALDEQKVRLLDIAESHAKLLSEIAGERFDRAADPRAAQAAALERIRGAYHNFVFHDLGATGVFFLVERSGKIVSLERDERSPIAPAEPSPGAKLPNASAHLDLKGQRGVTVVETASGGSALAAYSPIPALDLRLVAQIPMLELRAPFIRAALVASMVGAALIAVGLTLLHKIGKPMLQRLRESETIYQRLFDGSRVAMLILDTETTMPIAFNQALLDIVGYDRNEFARLPLDRHERNESAKEIRAHFADFACGRRLDFETAWRTKLGEVRMLAVNARILEMGGREVVHSVLTDITERMRSERQIRQLQEQLIRVGRASELGQALATLAHEVGQPMTAANNYVSAARKMIEGAGDGSTARAVAACAKASDQIARASSIIATLRDYLRNSEDAPKLEDVNGLVSEAMSLSLVDAAERGVSVTSAFARGLPAVSVQRIQIQQVVVNLLRNALEAMAGLPKREIEVETSRAADGDVVITVRDTGPGLPAHLGDQVFQPFVTTKADGIGMGLAIAVTIVERHGGRLWCEPGAAGAIFHVALPAAAATEAQESEE